MLTFLEKRGNRLVQELRQRALLVLDVDRHFLDYAIQLKPAEAKHFAELSLAAGQEEDGPVLVLMNLIDAIVPPASRGPDHPRTGFAHHLYLIGREVGKRKLQLRMMRTNFKPEADLTDLLNEVTGFGREASALVATDDNDHELLITFLWL